MSGVSPAWLASPAVWAEPEERDIRAWAEAPDGGGLPRESARAFADWLWENWNNWTEDEDTTVQQVLLGAVEEWCGGRTFG